MGLTLVRTIQNMTALSAAGASAVRGLGSPAAFRTACGYLSRLELHKFSVASEYGFRRILDQETNDFRDALPQKARYWGAIRQALNLFLRDAFYNFYLREQFNLPVSEPWYEVPLDAALVRALRKYDSGNTLSKWPGINKLTDSMSENYQLFALLVARENGISRVHLSAWLGFEEK